MTRPETLPEQRLVGSRLALRAAFFAAAGAALLIVAAANAAGYRYGVSDQEFYIPVVYLELDPALFPHDRPMFDAQDALFLAFDDVAAAVVRATGLSLPVLFLAGYAVALLSIFGGAWLIGRRWYASPWTAAALVAALTLRHQVPGTGVNTFEGYFQPRTLAFGLGLLAVAAFLRSRTWVMLLLTGGAALAHPTTAVWFAMWLGAAALVARRRSRLVAAGLAVCGLAAAMLLAWLVVQRGVEPMSDEWIAGASRRYLFFSRWPAWTWIAHAAVIGIAVFAYRRRGAAGLVTATERGIFIGAFALLAFFLAVIPFVEARIPLAVQLQAGRILWVWDVLATVYAIWLLAERPGVPSLARPRIVFAVLAVIACARGAYIMGWEFPDRPLVRMHLPGGEWGRVMAWASTTPIDSNFLAHPEHAWQYGVSVRIGARRDVFLEASKDPALAMYSEESAERVAARQRELGDFNQLDAARAAALARRYDLDYVITERTMDLPLVRRFGRFNVYRLQR
ncbi:MAG TPA: hypothetical protein VNK41_10605 [Vicinamibacterales bacterium]|nr:hypothetical protein [Vicinamibacterales bacterium]